MGVSKSKKTKGMVTSAQIERWRGRLKVSAAIDTLNGIVDGSIEATTARMRGVELTLRKVLPDLSSVEVHSGNDNVQFMWAKAKRVTETFEAASPIVDITPDKAVTDIEDAETLEDSQTSH